MDKKSVIITIILFFVCFPIGICYLIYKLVSNNTEESTTQAVQRIENEMSQQKQAHQDRLTSIKTKYGTPDKVVIIGYFKDELIVYDQAKKIILGMKEYGYCDVMSANVIEKKINIDGTETVTTKTNFGSVVGRSLIGGVIAGPAGAVIGGATASKTSVVNRTSTDDVFYEVVVKVRDLNNPLIKIECNSAEDAAELDSVFNYILSSK